MRELCIYVVIVLAFILPLLAVANWEYYPVTNIVYTPEGLAELTNAYYERVLIASDTWEDVTNGAMRWDFTPWALLQAISNSVITNTITNSYTGYVTNEIYTNVNYYWSEQYPDHGWYTNVCFPYVYIGATVTTTNEVDIFRDGAGHFGPDDDYYLTVADQIDLTLLSLHSGSWYSDLPFLAKQFAAPTTNSGGTFTDVPALTGSGFGLEAQFYKDIGIPQMSNTMQQSVGWYYPGQLFTTGPSTSAWLMAQWVITTNPPQYGVGTKLSVIPYDTNFRTNNFPILRWEPPLGNTNMEFPAQLQIWYMDLYGASGTVVMTGNDMPVTKMVKNCEIGSYNSVGFANHTGSSVTLIYTNPVTSKIRNESGYWRFWTPDWMTEKCQIVDNMYVVFEPNIYKYTNSQIREGLANLEYTTRLQAYNEAAGIYQSTNWVATGDGPPGYSVTFTGSGTNNGCTIRAIRSQIVIDTKQDTWPGSPSVQIYAMGTLSGYSDPEPYGTNGIFLEGFAAAGDEYLTGPYNPNYDVCNNDSTPSYKTDEGENPIDNASDWALHVYTFWNNVLEYLK